MRLQAAMIAGLTGALALGGLLYAERTTAQPAQMPMAPGAQMMGPGPQMSTGMMMGQMQQQMDRMTATLRAMRARLDAINPALLTPSERAMLDYLKLLQTQLETMHGWMGTAQGMLQQMPARR